MNPTQSDDLVLRGLRALRAAQARGEAPAPGAVSRREIARRCRVHHSVVARIEHVALAKLDRALAADDALLLTLLELRDSRNHNQ